MSQSTPHYVAFTQDLEMVNLQPLYHKREHSMEVYELKKDIHVFGITATSFPEGIEVAFQKLCAMLPAGTGREFYGISHPNKSGSIVYKAMVRENFSDEGKKYNCQSFVIKQGLYLSEKIIDFRIDPILIGKTFQSILKDPRIDHRGYCLEVYTGISDVLCMVPLDQKNKIRI